MQGGLLNEQNPQSFWRMKILRKSGIATLMNFHVQCS